MKQQLFYSLYKPPMDPEAFRLYQKRQGEKEAQLKVTLDARNVTKSKGSFARFSPLAEMHKKIKNSKRARIRLKLNWLI